jgi:hypothetical protein
VINVSSGQKVLLYILLFIFPVIGIFLGIIWMNDQDAEKKQIGKNYLVFAIVAIVLSSICWIAALVLSIGPAVMGGY